MEDHREYPVFMMTSTHAFVGALMGATTAVFAPELTPTVVVVGFVGGTLPDVDLLASHRRSLHFPVYATALAVPVAVAAAVLATPLAVLLAVFTLSVAVHCAMDIFAGGVETRPWEETSEQAVYNHFSGRWIRPRRWVRYAGAPEDLVVATVCCLPTLAVTTGPTRLFFVTVLVCSALFVAVRRRLATLTERLVADTTDV
jgi:hypothetical protein